MLIDMAGPVEVPACWQCGTPMFAGGCQGRCHECVAAGPIDSREATGGDWRTRCEQLAAELAAAREERDQLAAELAARAGLYGGEGS